MKFYGIDMRGELKIERVSSLPTVSQGRFVILTNSSDLGEELYFGTSTGWEKVDNRVLSTSDPTVTDDSYNIGTVWINTSTGKFYVCTDNTSSAAVWGGEYGGTATQARYA